jgi:hypothetical protein
VPPMRFSNNEHALSEVIGFILIIVVIITAFSLYITYAVPAQGRENEIKHMDDVKDELVGYKIGVDALWTNGQLESLMSTTIHMGTPGATTQGTGGILPIVQPIGSSGTVAINQRPDEWLNISSYSYVMNQTYRMNDTPTNITSLKIYKSYPNPPDSLLINISGLRNIGQQLIPSAVPSVPVLPLTPNSSRSINITGTDQQGTVWLAQINLTQRITFFQNYYIKTSACVAADNTNGTAFPVRTPTVTTACLIPLNQLNYTGTDLTITVFKNNTRTLSETILYRDISASRTPYVIDLLEPAYGLSSNIRATSTIIYNEYDPNKDVVANATAMYAYNLLPNYNYNISLGAIEYQSHNNYWIPQTYYYQMGGIFLNQTDGVSSKVPPSITFGYNRTGAIAVNIIGLGFDPANTGSIGGTSPIQIGTMVKSNSGDLPYAPITNNTMNFTINFTSPTNDPKTAAMWKQVFQDAANKTGGIPGDGIPGKPPNLYYVGNTISGANIIGSYIVVKGVYDTGGVNSNTPDINLRVKVVNLTTSIQSMSGV